MGLMATHFIPRYALVLLIPAPLLIMSAWPSARGLRLGAAAGGHRHHCHGPGRPGHEGDPQRPRGQEAALNPHVDFWAVRDGLTGSGTDLCSNRILQDLWGTSPAEIWSV